MKSWFVGLILAALSVQASGDELTAKEGTIRTALPGMNNTAGYVTLTNTGKLPIVLVGGESSIADTVELHTHTMADGMMRMERVMEVAIDGGQTVTFQPGGLHLMFIGLQDRNYADVTVTLLAKDGRRFNVELQAKSPNEHQHHH